MRTKTLMMSLMSPSASMTGIAGGHDKGIDIAGFLDDQLLLGLWDCFQCKHYNRPLRPGDAWPELGKILWYSFKGDYKAPRAYYFAAPRNAGTTLSMYLANAAKLKAELKAAWKGSVAKAITDKEEILLEGAFAEYVDAFDFSIFREKPVLELIEEHRTTPYFAQRFGGGLLQRFATLAVWINVIDRKVIPRKFRGAI